MGLCILPFLHNRLGRTLGLAGIAVAGTGLASQYGVPLADAHLAIESGHVQAYSYGEGTTCSHTAEGSWVDPISVVFWSPYDQNDADVVDDHAGDHGDWSHGGDSSEQYFLTHGYCRIQDDDAASQDQTPPDGFPSDNWHMRFITGRNDSGDYDRDPKWRYYTLATPHHEALVDPDVLCGSSYHSVDDNETEPPGGFVRAAEDIKDNWTGQGPHQLSAYEYWGNTQRFQQSAKLGPPESRCWEAANDGFVIFIKINQVGSYD